MFSIYKMEHIDKGQHYTMLIAHCMAHFDNSIIPLSNMSCCVLHVHVITRGSHSLLCLLNVLFLKVLSLQNQLKLCLPNCLVDDGLNMPSSIYDLIRAINAFQWCSSG